MAEQLDPSLGEPEQHSWLVVLIRVLRDAGAWVTSESSRLAAAGIIWFSVLTLTYEQFYGSLGVSATDLGLSYTNLLASSVGTALAVLVATILYTSLALGLGTIFLRPLHPRLRRAFSGPGLYTTIPLLLIVIAVAISFVFLPYTALKDSRAVRLGGRVRPARIAPLPISILSVRADPVIVRRSGLDPPPWIRDLERTGKLVYLGQANGTLILYDVERQRSVAVPQQLATVVPLPY
jgi:hypothetical protein